MATSSSLLQRFAGVMAVISLVPIRSTGLSARALALRCTQRPLRSANAEYGANTDGLNGFGRHADGAIVKRSERSLSARAERPVERLVHFGLG